MVLILLLAIALTAGCESDDVAQRAATLRETIGVNTHYASGGGVDGEALARLAGAGVSFIRNDLTWASVERERGVYDFAGSGFDALVDRVESLGMRILFILDYGNPLYGEQRAVIDENGRRAFAAFAAAAASRYGGRGHRWEIWNEPNLLQFWSSAEGGPDPQRYADLAHATVPALRAADPHGEIVAGALFFLFPEVVEILRLGIGGPRFLESLATYGALALVDGVTLHLYRFGGPETAATDVGIAREILARTGYPLPVWSGEWGYSTYDPDAPPTGVNYLPAVTPNQQASYIARMLLLNFQLGVEHSVIFKDRDERNGDPGNIEHHFGLMFEDLAPKPALTAVATLTELLGDADPPDTLPLGSGEHGLVFSVRGERRVALWSEQPATWLLQGSTDARIRSREGTDVTPADFASGSRFTLDVDDGPVYLLGNVTVTPAD